MLLKSPSGGRTLSSNMCQLRAVVEKVFKYNLTITPAVGDSLTKLKHQIVKGAAGALTKLLGNYVHSGNQIYSFRFVKETKPVISTLSDPKTKTAYEVSVEFCKEICLRDFSGFNMEQTQELETVFNIFLRKVMEGQKLLALQRNRYFNLAEARSVVGENLNSVTGYFLSISAIKEGLYLTIDTINEFFRKTNCLEEIQEKRKQGLDERGIATFFRGKRVSLLGAKGKTLRVQGVNFALTPVTFRTQPGDVPLAKSWEEKYHVKLTFPGQPLLKAKKDGEMLYLMPEFCYITGAEDEMRRSGKSMADMMGPGAEPPEKSSKIAGMFERLKRGNVLEQYGLVMSEQERVLMQFLPQPQLSLGPGKTITPAALSRGVRIMTPINFDRWLFLYDSRNYANAGALYDTMVKASASLGVKIKEPNWIEFERMGPEAVEDRLKSAKPGFQFAFALLSDRRQYKKVKQVLDVAHGVVSQCAFANPKRMHDVVFASGIIRQINAKLGGDLYSVDLPGEIPKNTMFVGIDVCHCRRNSVVGFYANCYTNLAHCYCETAVQRKGQELVSSILVPFYASALKSYLKQQGTLPEYIFIFRDGVGRGQREQILTYELPQVKEAVSHMRAGYSPAVTLLIVNKRIHQRFLNDTGATVTNPEPGTIIDSGVTEAGCENFFMISARTRVGTIRPTHYYVAHNERKEVTKEVIQKVCYAMSFMYYNSTSSIKVPAHIALADKKAYYGSVIEGASNKKLANTQSFL